jgi:aminopeptidase-like protein
MGGTLASEAVMAMLWTLASSDGSTTLLRVAELAGLDFATVAAAADRLEAAQLLRRATADDRRR